MDNIHREAGISKLYNRRISHVYNFMFKQKNNDVLLDIRDIRTRAHDAILFNTVSIQPFCEIFKHNVYNYGV